MSKKIVKSDVSIAKNYLIVPELDYIERIDSLYLDLGELQAVRKIPMTIEDWAKRSYRSSKQATFLDYNAKYTFTNFT